MLLNIEQIRILFKYRTQHQGVLNYFATSDSSHYQNDYEWHLEEDGRSNDKFLFNVILLDKVDKHKSFEFILLLTEEVKNQVMNLCK